MTTVSQTTSPNRTYHGLPARNEIDGGRIVVEPFGGGPTQREAADLLYELVNPYGNYGPHNFWWGYSGSNPHETADVILTDAVPGQLSADLIHDFVVDVVAHLDTEWHLNRGMIVRWVRGWHAEHDPPATTAA